MNAAADKENNKPTILRETTQQTQKPPSSLNLFSSKTDQDHTSGLTGSHVTANIPKPKIIESKPVTRSSSSSLNNSNDSSSNSPYKPEVVQSSGSYKPEVVTSPVSETRETKILNNSEIIVTKTSPARRPSGRGESGGPHDDVNKVVTPPPVADTEIRKISTTSTSPEVTNRKYNLPEVPKVIPAEVAKVTSAIGWKPSILQSSSSSVEESEVEMNLEQRVS